MRPVDDKECSNYGANATHNGRQHRKNPASRAKTTPSKWDDAQKWLVGLSNGGDAGDRGHGGGKAARPRNSNADDRRLLSSSSQNGRVSCSSVDGALEYNMVVAVPAPPTPQPSDDGETKKIDCMLHGSPVAVCLRDMGTEMTPIASKEPSRTGTPLRASTPVSSRPATPTRRRQDGAGCGDARPTEPVVPSEMDGACDVHGGSGDADHVPPSANSLESRAAAWDEAERAKFMARYKREEVKIQAWENHEKRRAEMAMKKIEIKAEQMKARAQQKLANKLAATRRMAEEKRANAEAELNESASRTSEKADYIRRTGHLPSFFSFKLPSLCG